MNDHWDGCKCRGCRPKKAATPAFFASDLLALLFAPVDFFALDENLARVGFLAPDDVGSSLMNSSEVDWCFLRDEKPVDLTTPEAFSWIK